MKRLTLSLLSLGVAFGFAWAPARGQDAPATEDETELAKHMLLVQGQAQFLAQPH